MKFRIGAVFSAAALLCACSHTSKRQSMVPLMWPPADLIAGSASENPIAIDHEYESALRKNPSEPMRFIVRYRQAKLWSPIDAAKACALWLEVAEPKRFPLQGLAQLRALETCPKERAEVAAYASDSSGDEAWLKSTAARARLARAIATGDRKGEMRHSLEAAPSERVPGAQVKLIERASVLATELGDEEAGEKAELLLQRFAPRLIKDPKPEQLIAVASDLRKAREFERSRTVYRRILGAAETSDVDKLRALDGIRMSFKLEQKRENYVTATREYSDFARSRYLKAPTRTTRGSRRREVASELNKYVDTRLTLARAVWTENSAKEAAKILKALESELRGRHPLTESFMLRARIEEEGGRLKSAAKLLARIDENKLSERGLKAKLTWQHAWVLRKLGRHAEAVARFEKLAAEEETPSQVARARFWLGRSLKESAQDERAQKEFEWLIGNDPIGYYGALAHRELGRPLARLLLPGAARVPAAQNPGEARVAVKPDVEASDAILRPDERQTFEWLISTQEFEIARRFLDHHTASRRSGLNPNQTFALLELYGRAGAYQSLFGHVADAAPELRREILDKNPELIFPRPWSDLIESSARKYGVAPELVYSIIRQESSFNALSRSPADAFGLMQLIPEVASLASKSTGLEYSTPEDLFKPELNVPLGVAFLRETLGRWNGRFIPSVASYNASEKAVEGWLRTRDRRDVLQFIEDIPYEETRGYVKLVMRNFIFYSRLSSRQDSIPFPEWCLAGIQDAKSLTSATVRSQTDTK